MAAGPATRARGLAARTVEQLRRRNDVARRRKQQKERERGEPGEEHERGHGQPRLPLAAEAPRRGDRAEQDATNEPRKVSGPIN